MQWKAETILCPSATLISPWYIYLSPDSCLWVRMESPFLLEIRGKQAVRHIVKDSTETLRISAIVGDKNGDMWFGNGEAGREGKLLRLRNEKWDEFSLPREQGEDVGQIRSLAIDSTGMLWIGTFSNGLYKFDGTNWTRFLSPSSGLSSNSIMAMEVNSKGALWLATGNGGLNKFDGTSFTVYATTNSPIPSDNLELLAIDKTDRLWITVKSKLVSFDGKTWKIFDTTNSPLVEESIFHKWQIACTIDGKIWVDDGATTINGSTLKVYDPSVVGVAEAEVPQESGGVEIFPNPAASRLQVRSGRAGIRAEVFTVLGQSVGFAESAGESVEFSTESLPTGAYFVRVWSGGKMTTKAFQVSK